MIQQIQKEITSQIDIISELTTSAISSHLRLDFADETDYLTALAQAAFEAVQNEMNDNLNGYTLRLFCDEMPSYFTLPASGFRVSVSSASYYDSNNDSQSIATNLFSVDGTHPAFVSYFGDELDLNYNRKMPIVMEFAVSEAALSDSVKMAVLLTMGHLYERRESVAETKVYEVPRSVSYLISGLKKTSMRWTSES